ncbi:MAG: CapA family protein [Phycisphaerae bacterium]
MFQVDPVSGRWTSQGEQLAVPALRILSAGDFCPAARTQIAEKIESGPDGIQSLYGNVMDILCEKDLSVVNLAGPAGVALSAATIDAVLAGQFDAINLAGCDATCPAPQSLGEMIESARSAGLEVIGAGPSPSAARRPVVMDVNGMRVGLVAAGEGPPAMAAAAVNTLDPARMVLTIGDLHGRCDLVLVYVCGGRESCPIPSPRTVRLYRSFIEAGADAVIGCGARTAGPIEFYESRPILYNLGSFAAVDSAGQVPPLWGQSMLVRLEFKAGRLGHLQVVPAALDSPGGSIHILQSPAREEFLGRLNRLGQIVADRQAHQRFWDACCLAHWPQTSRRLAELTGSSESADAVELLRFLGHPSELDLIARSLELTASGAGVDEDVSEQLAELLEPGAKQGQGS